MPIDKMSPKIKLKPGKPEFIAKRIFNLIKNVDLDITHKFVFNISEKLAEKIKQEKDFSDIKSEIIKFVEKETDINLEEKTSKLQKIWNKKNDAYFSHLKKKLETDFKFKEYIGYTANVMVGNYGGDNKFIIRISEKLDDSVYIIAEEVLHLVYWDIWKRTFDKNIEKPWLLNKDNDKGLSVWKISETIPEYIFNIDSSREKSYKWLPEVKKILDPLWKNRKSFKDFLIKAHKGVIE